MLWIVRLKILRNLPRRRGVMFAMCETIPFREHQTRIIRTMQMGHLGQESLVGV